MDAPFPGSLWRLGLPPDVYEVRPQPPTRLDVRMDVAAFIGLTERGPVCEPIEVESWEQFRLRFGQPGGGRILPECVHQFFLNGGRRCVVVRAVAAEEASTAVWALPGLVAGQNAEAARVFARDPGRWGNRIRTRVKSQSRILPIRAVGEDRRRVVEEAAVPTVDVGALLRFVVDDDGREKSVFRFVGEVEEAKEEAHVITLSEPLPESFVAQASPGPQDLTPVLVQEVTVTLVVSVDEFVETFEALALHPDHSSRFLYEVLEKESLILRPDPSLFVRGRTEIPLFPADEARLGEEVTESEATALSTTRPAALPGLTLTRPGTSGSEPVLVYSRLPAPLSSRLATELRFPTTNLDASARQEDVRSLRLTNAAGVVAPGSLVRFLPRSGGRRQYLFVSAVRTTGDSDLEVSFAEDIPSNLFVEDEDEEGETAERPRRSLAARVQAIGLELRVEVAEERFLDVSLHPSHPSGRFLPEVLARDSLILEPGDSGAGPLWPSPETLRQGGEESDWNTDTEPAVPGLFTSAPDDPARMPLAVRLRSLGSLSQPVRIEVRFRTRALGMGAATAGPLSPPRPVLSIEVDRSPRLLRGVLLRLSRGGGRDPELRFIEGVVRGEPTDRVILDRPLPPDWEGGPVEEIQTDVVVAIQGEVFPSPSTSPPTPASVDFHPDRSGFLLRLLQDSSRLLRPDRTQYEEGRVERAIWPADSSVGSGARAAPRPGNPLVPGDDGASATRRHHFFVRPKVDADRPAAERVYSRRPSPLDALLESDERNPLQPSSMLHMPDLAHARPREERSQVLPDPRRAGTRFDICVVPRPGVDIPEEDYLHLSLQQPGAFDDLMQRHRELVEWCTDQGDRVAILDLPPGLTPEETRRWRLATASDHAALYAPYLRSAPAQNATGPLLTVPPGGAVCGVIARREASLGVQAAPANEVLAGVVQPDPRPLPDAGFLHDVHVNLIRSTERGYAVMGSRTTSRDPQWYHLSARRLVDYLKRQLAVDAFWAVFEPNNQVLWTRLTLTANRRLLGLFQRGAFAGSSPEEAWFVRCDGELNRTADLDAGRVKVLVGVAPATPAEFVVFQLNLLESGRVDALELSGARS